MFIALLVLVTSSIAGCAAYFSIVGLAAIFAGVHTPVLIMGTVLEAGKLTAASYLYRYWEHTGKFLRMYLIAAVLGLMIMTSAGIFGQLSKGYQTDTMSLRDIQTQTQLLTTEKQELQVRKTEIDKQIAQLPTNSVRGRAKLMATFAPELDKINVRIPEITKAIQEMSSKQIDQESHVGPIIYIAKAFHTETDDATKWLVLLIVFAFDPLAVSMTIATNTAISVREREKKEAAKTPQTIVQPWEPLPPTPTEPYYPPKSGLESMSPIQQPIIAEPMLIDEPEHTIASMDEAQIDSLINQAMTIPASEQNKLIPEVVSRLQKAVNIIDSLSEPTENQMRTKEKIKNILRKKLT